MNIKYKNFKIISSENFIIFKINDFLNHDQYNLLSKCFNKFKVSDIFHKDNLKYSISSNDEMFEKLQNIPEVYNLIQEIREKTLNIILKKLFFHIWKARYFSLNILFKLILSILGFKNVFKSQIEMSYIKNNGLIEPHLDGKKKLLSLMLYFPDKLENEKFDKFQKKIGTNFIINSTKLKKNIHLKSSKEKEVFHKNTKRNVKLEFEPLILFGFIKNDLSWHEVEKINIHPDYIRKSINLNYLI